MIRKLTAQDIPRANELFAIAFEQPMERRPAEPDEAGVCRWGVFDDVSGDMMSTLMVTDFSVRFDGHACKLGGIGGVATLPQYRRRGGIRGCFEAMLPDLYANGYDFSYLYPFSTGYYRKFGYESCVRKLHTTVHLGLLKPQDAPGTLQLAEPGVPLAEDIRAVDAAWESRYNMMVLHRPEDYDWLEKQDPAAKQEFTYVYRAPDGTPKAYTSFTKADQSDGRNLVCSRFFFTDREGFAGLMTLFKCLSSDHMLAKFTLPSSAAMEYLLPEWSMGAASWSVQPAGMARVVNAASVLRKARYVGDGVAVLEIRDPQIPENSRTYRIYFSDGAAQGVEETQAKPQATLTISAFSALTAGVCDFYDAAQWMDGVQVHREADALPRVFYRKPLMIADYF